MAVGIDQRAFAEFFFVLPLGFAGLEILAGPAFAFGIAVEIIAHLDDAAMMVGHDFVRIDLLSGELAAAGRDFEKVAAHAVAGTDIDEAVRINRRWDDCDVSFARRAPEQLAVG